MDPAKGLWRSTNISTLSNHITNWLFKTREWFFPGGRVYCITYTFFTVTSCSVQQQERFPLEKIVYPFKVPELSSPDTKSPAQQTGIETRIEEPEESNTEGEETKRKRFFSTTPAPAEKKKSLLALAHVTPKDFQKENKIPTTGNTMAKLKYSDFKKIWEAFCENATVQQLEQYEKKFSELCLPN